MGELQAPILPTRLYRYRSLARRGTVARELDAILSNYVYCSRFSQMNDPMEGFFRTSRILEEKTIFDDALSQVILQKPRIGIASFTETHEDVLMWTHYAGNYDGICVSYMARRLVKGLPEAAKLVRLAYVDQPPLVFPSHLRNIHRAAEQILSQKKYNWAYEREWRVLAGIGKVSIGKTIAADAVFLGSRVEEATRRKIVRALKGSKIKIYAMEVDGYSHSWHALHKDDVK